MLSYLVKVHKLNTGDKQDMARNQNSQSKHDNEVRKIADPYKRRGYDVAADI